MNKNIDVFQRFQGNNGQKFPEHARLIDYTHVSLQNHCNQKPSWPSKISPTKFKHVQSIQQICKYLSIIIIIMDFKINLINCF